MERLTFSPVEAKGNLWGNSTINREVQLVDTALETVMQRNGYYYCYPGNRDLWTQENPRYGTCITTSVLAKNIWGRNIGDDSSKWNPNARFLVYWVYENETKYLERPRANHIDVHYSFWSADGGEIDLSLNQFPKEYFLTRRKHPGTKDWKPTNSSWFKEAEIPEKSQKLVKEIKPIIIALLQNSQLKISPQLSQFLYNNV